MDMHVTWHVSYSPRKVSKMAVLVGAVDLRLTNGIRWRRLSEQPPDVAGNVIVKQEIARRCYSLATNVCLEYLGFASIFRVFHPVFSIPVCTPFALLVLSLIHI